MTNVMTWQELFAVARRYGYPDAAPRHPDALNDEGWALLSKALWAAAEAEAGRKLNEYGNVTVGAKEVAEWVLIGRLAVPRPNEDSG